MHRACGTALARGSRAGAAGRSVCPGVRHGSKAMSRSDPLPRGDPPRGVGEGKPSMTPAGV
ncbi:hypothetical protein F9278_38940 [Streptomyces phaeolivaceus]|uniref:Uncharacterized protein n=1 Tax=Streptomyces phaeolivaceus TaxID=2653200 RepID=A0A5P8KJW3_9ACTN|nr:hypothetical protein F9278_38940 [Streptomyces phaeolivaceus]